MSWNKGRTKENDQKVASNAAGISRGVAAYWARLTPEERSARTKSWRDRSRTPSAIKKMRISKTGRKVPKLSEPARLRFTGKPKPESQRIKMAMAQASFMERRGHVYWPTSIERIVAATMDALGIEYLTQRRLGRYVVDILVPSRKIAIECDGTYWHSRPGRPERDAEKTRGLESLGYKVVRLSEAAIKAGGHVDVLRSIA